MQIKQNLNNYTDKYTKLDLWTIFETEHYVFHYFRDSIAEREIKNISQTQENSYVKITSTLGLEKYQKLYLEVSRENSEEENIKIFETILGSLDEVLKKFNSCYI